MDYKLSVIFITYNHAQYVEKALMSVVNQKTDFPFEVVVGDDCSTDGTQDILKRIAALLILKVTTSGRTRISFRSRSIFWKLIRSIWVAPTP